MREKAKREAERVRNMPGCSVPACERDAVVEVILYDVYLDGNDRFHDVFYAEDETCPYLCYEHLQENENRCRELRESEMPSTSETPVGATRFISVEELVTRPISLGERTPKRRTYRGAFTYPFTDQHRAKGFNIYRSLHGRSL